MRSGCGLPCQFLSRTAPTAVAMRASECAPGSGVPSDFSACGRARPMRGSRSAVDAAARVAASAADRPRGGEARAGVDRVGEFDAEGHERVDQRLVADLGLAVGHHALHAGGDAARRHPPRRASPRRRACRRGSRGSVPTARRRCRRRGPTTRRRRGRARSARRLRHPARRSPRRGRRAIRAACRCRGRRRRRSRRGGRAHRRACRSSRRSSRPRPRRSRRRRAMRRRRAGRLGLGRDVGGGIRSRRLHDRAAAVGRGVDRGVPQLLELVIQPEQGERGAGHVEARAVLAHVRVDELDARVAAAVRRCGGRRRTSPRT